MTSVPLVNAMPLRDTQPRAPSVLSTGLLFAGSASNLVCTVFEIMSPKEAMQAILPVPPYYYEYAILAAQ